MSNIILRIPRHKKRIKIIKAKDLLQKELDSYIPPLPPEPEKVEEEIVDVEYNSIVKEPDLPEIDIPAQKKTIFSQSFSIGNSNKTVEISLKKIKPQSISVSEAMIEVQSAYDTGFKHGKETSDAEYNKEIRRHEEWIRNIDSVIQNVKKQFDKELSVFADILVDTAIEIAEKIIVKAIDKDKNIVVTQFKNAMAKIKDDNIIELRINPRDKKIIKACKAKLFSDNVINNDFNIISDSSINEGNCKLITGAGLIDTEIKKQLDVIAQEIENELEMPEYKVESNMDEETQFDLMPLDKNQQSNSNEDDEYGDLKDLDLFKEF